MAEPATPSRESGIPRLTLVLGLVLATLAAYAKAPRAEFVRYDDDVYVLENPIVQGGLDARAVTLAFTTRQGANWHPVTWLSHALDVELFGLEDAGGHHLTSVLLHALNGALVFLLLARVTGSGAALAVAALFALHPLRVESVAWVSERKDVLSSTFLLLTLGAWGRWARKGSRAAYGAALALYALGLMAKPMLVTLPVLLVLLDAWPLERGPWRRLLPEKLPFLALALLVAAVTVATQRAEGATADLTVLPLDARVANAFVAGGAYLVDLLWPRGLAVFYPHPAVFGDRQLVPALLWATALAASLVLAWRLRARAPWFLVGLLWSCVLLAPVIGVVQVGMQARADRYTYLASLGILVPLALGGRALAARSDVLRSWLPAATVLASVVLAQLTFRQVSTWRDTELLFLHARAVTERNWVAARMLGREYEARGDLVPAIEAFEEEVRIGLAPRVPLEKLGELYARTGRLRFAVERLGRARDLAPTEPGLELDLATLYLQAGDLDRARRALDAAAAKGAREAEGTRASYLAGLVAQRAGRLPEAEAAYRAVLELDPAHADAWNNLGEVLLGTGRPEEAVEAFRRLVELEPEGAPARFNLGVALESAGDAGAARAAFREALALNPGFEPARARLGAREAGDTPR